MDSFVDAAAHERFAESKTKLLGLLALELLSKMLGCVPGNKIDHYDLIS